MISCPFMFNGGVTAKERLQNSTITLDEAIELEAFPGLSQTAQSST